MSPEKGVDIEGLPESDCPEGMSVRDCFGCQPCRIACWLVIAHLDKLGSSGKRGLQLRNAPIRLAYKQVFGNLYCLVIDVGESNTLWVLPSPTQI